MLTLIVGGAASGKSEYGERLSCALGITPRYYLATMRPMDDESEMRVRKHQRMRKNKGFETLERYTDLAHLSLPRRGLVLLECMSNLVANEQFSRDGAGEHTVEAVLGGVEQVLRQSREMIVISNEVFSGGDDYAADTLRYLQYLGQINCALAARASRVCEVVCGVPTYYKGAEPV